MKTFDCFILLFAMSVCLMIFTNLSYNLTIQNAENLVKIRDDLKKYDFFHLETSMTAKALEEGQDWIIDEVLYDSYGTDEIPQIPGDSIGNCLYCHDQKLENNSIGGCGECH